MRSQENEKRQARHNCMTPGSEFRSFIQKSLKYLINAKSIQGQMQLQRERKHIMMNVIVDFYQ